MVSNKTALEAIIDLAARLQSRYDHSRHSHLVRVWHSPDWQYSKGGTIALGISTRRSLDLVPLIKENQQHYDETLKLITDEPILAPAMGGLLGTSSGTQLFDAEFVVRHCLAIPQTGNNITPDASVIRERFQLLAHTIRSKTSDAHLLVPIVGLDLGGVDRVEISSTVELRHFSPSEAEACARAGLLAPFNPGVPIIQPHAARGICAIIPMETVILSQSEARNRRPKIPPPYAFGHFHWLQLPEMLHDLLFILRLAHFSRFSAPGALLLHNGISGPSYRTHRRPTVANGPGTYAVYPETADAIRKLWTQLSSMPHKRSIPRICIRRFNSAHEPSNIEDVIADLTIAAEALFLNDSQSDRNELGFRLQLRAARLLAIDGHDPSVVVNVFKEAYALRSSVVHGSELSPSKTLKRFGVPLEEFVVQFKATMRHALLAAVAGYQSQRDFGTSDYWQRLLFD